MRSHCDASGTVFKSGLTTGEPLSQILNLVQFGHCLWAVGALFVAVASLVGEQLAMRVVTIKPSARV